MVIEKKNISVVDEMPTSKMNSCISASRPSTAKEIKVTNFFSPYFMRALDIKEDSQRKIDLSHLLPKVSKFCFKNREENYLPNVNHHVIMSTSSLENDLIYLPHWYCRGTVVGVCSETADVLLVDYGIVINVSHKSIAKYPESAVSIKPLSYTIGIYNVLPLDLEKNVCKNWPKHTNNFVKDLIQASKEMYFDIVAHDKNSNRIFGDLILVIDNKNLSLRQVLLESQMAIALNDEILKVEKNCDPKIDFLQANTCEKENNSINPDKSTSSENENNSCKALPKPQNVKKVDTVDKILIHSKTSCHRLEELAESGFATHVLKALQKNGISKPKQIQSYMWPAIKQGLNVTTIAPGSSGKTLGYVVPILSAIATNEEMVDVQKSDVMTKPIVLVLCATAKACVDVAGAFDILTNYQNKIKCSQFINGMSDKDLMTKICNKCEVIVSTPTFLLRLLSKNFGSKLNLSELSYVVLDHADVILNKYLKEVISLIKDYKIFNQNFTNCIQGSSSQTIVVSRTWTSEIDSFISNFVENSYTCIGSFTEAAAYNGVQGRMLIRHSDKKKYEVLEALKNYKTQKTLIFCLDSNEACELNQFLSTNNIETLLVHDDMEYNEINELKNNLEECLPQMFPAIICTDAVLPEFPISDVEYLIHYSVTHTSKTQFNRRFSVLMDNWSEESDKKCKILILFDETKDSVHFKGVVEILKRFKVDLPEDWNTIADGLEIQDNIKKKDYPLCNNIKSFGYCNAHQSSSTNQSCPYRHRVIAEADVPQIPEISIGDDLKLLITRVHSVTHYSARVLECIKTSATGKDKKVLNLPHIPHLPMKIKSFYSHPENRKSPKEIVPGLVCVAKNKDIYTRVKVLKIVDTHPNGKPRNVKYQSLDDGEIREKASVVELYEISNELLNCKLPIVNVYLTGIAPFDEENEWVKIANESAADWFRKYLDAHSFIYAKVLLHIGDCIWTDSLVIRSQILGYQDLVSSCLKKNMIDQGHGFDNKKHLSHLIHLCVSSGMTEINGQSLESSEDEREQKD